MSPLLFALAIESLVETIHASKAVSGVDIGNIRNKILQHTDNFILYLSEPELSAPAVFIIYLLSLFKNCGNIWL